MKKENIILKILIILLLIFNSGILVRNLLISYNAKNSIEIDKDISLIRVSKETVTQGAVVSYELEKNNNLNDIEVKILNSINREIGDATVLDDDTNYKILIDTSEFAAGTYRIKINDSVSKETFSVILVEAN